MVRRAIRTDRLIAVLGVVVIVLGALAIWFVTRGSGGGFTEEPTSRRVLRQAREQLGRTAEVQLIEPGRGRVVCGYIADGLLPEVCPVCGAGKEKFKTFR